MKTPYLIALFVAVLAIGTVSLTAPSASASVSRNKSAPGSDPGRFEDIICVQQLDRLGNFVKMLCLSPDHGRGGRMSYRTPPRPDSEVWGDLDRQRAVLPFWN